ncbi:MAG: dehydrogenase [Pelagibacteraceae bacterium]|nr:dehydrogenase [Pelagibacteraceae bacterium]PPR10067.1 MAG: (S)-1-Phenylethanol dehydrogenase [Alphaproteobacteria bacterium MarineAlpha11_Bin1]|tara:strand:+ start:8555 stop:9313 length:759 start_codon:yes stop_codon:yes gene_type:complete
MTQLKGKTAIVTGAAQGIGAVYAGALAAEGAKVCLSDILDTTDAVRAIEEKGGEAMGMKVDVTDMAACEVMVSETLSAFGTTDILVTNAALFAALERRSFLEIDGDEWDKVMAINTRGMFNCIKAAAPEMKKKGYGKIINISSTTIYSGVPLMLHYVASKGAVDAMTKALARELGGDGITVNSIAPGLTMSDQIEAQRNKLEFYVNLSLNGRCVKREQTPDDLLGALIYLASPASDFVTGQAIVVDGGMIMH